MPKSPEIPEGWSFIGFKGPRYTQTPDELFDQLLAPGVLTCGELRVLLYLVRHTFGWKKDSDTISLTQITDGIVRRDGERLDWGAGVVRSTAVDAIKGLEAKGIIGVHRSRSNEKGYEASTFTLVVDGNPWFDKATRGNRPWSDKATRGSTNNELGLVALSDLQQPDVQQTTIQEDDSNVTDAGKIETPTYSPWIAGVIEDYSREFGEPNTAPMNISRALRMWQEADIGERAFVELLRRSHDLTRQAQGAQGNGKINRKMAYFFSVVADQAGGG